jgi:gamma-glutamyltranspeptidase/glutathione hydrolase
MSRAGFLGRSHATGACFGLVALAAVSFAAVGAFPEAKPAANKHGMVVAVSAPGAETGRDILLKGGNAVDAAVATAFAMAVTYPSAGNLGGGGFMVVYPGHGAEPVVFEYRETAPSAARSNMFAKTDSIYSHKAVGVPGTVRGMWLAHQRFGKLPWKDVVAPAVRLAEEGFILNDTLADSLNWVVGGSPEFPELQRVLGKNGAADWRAGDRLVQPDLARTLRLIMQRGPDGFYTGPVAEMIAAEMRNGKGLITLADLASYRANERKPIHGTYRGYDIYAPPPPSSGGTCLVEMLNVLENFDLRQSGRWSPETLHLIIETMRRAYCDRARYLGDADFVSVPTFLTDKAYAKRLAKSIDLAHATRSESLATDIAVTGESDNTTHFSVVDGDGMAVANTYTLERTYGSRIVPKGAGFILNNEMMDFNWFPGVTTRDGTIGTPPNQIAPRKRMLSSQTPTVVAKDGKAVLVTGSPGSRTIINTVLQVVINVVDFGMDARQAVDAPRLHHQWFPDRVRFEGIAENQSAIAKLRAMGHVVTGTRQGDAHTIYIDARTGEISGAEDRRIMGKAAGF